MLSSNEIESVLYSGRNRIQVEKVDFGKAKISLLLLFLYSAKKRILKKRVVSVHVFGYFEHDLEHYKNNLYNFPSN